MATLTDQIQKAAEAPQPQAQVQSISTILDDIISASEAGSAARSTALQMKSDYAEGLLFSRGVTATKRVDPADIAMRIRFGRELGLSAFQSARGLYFVNGIPAMMGTVLELLMRRHGYGWKFLQRDVKGCKLQLVKAGEAVNGAVASFSEEDAKRMKLSDKDTYKQDPESMFFWRALGRLQKFYVPEATEYISVLAPGEVPIEEVVTATEDRISAATALREKMESLKEAE